MKFAEKLKNFATGKTELERKQESAAMKEIRKEARAAALRERKTQAIRLATEREKVRVNRQIKILNQPREPASAYFNYGTPFGQPRFSSKSSSKKKKSKIPKRYNAILGRWE